MIDISKLLNGDRRTLAKAITLVESSRPEDNLKAHELIEQVFPNTGKSLRIGITGVPGVGKSTFIESFGSLLINKNHKVAVLAIDPSSPISGGSILGDKTRMELLSQNENAFIRPSPSLGHLGGVGQKTREAILLCEAAGFDYILVETVGVGQSEFNVADMVDFFMVLLLPNAGDELQGIKKGILELADSVVINKADTSMVMQATQTMAQYSSALELVRHNPHWKPKVLQCSAVEKKGLEEICDMLEEYKKIALLSGYFNQKRLDQNKDWFLNLIDHIVKLRLNSNVKFEQKKEKLQQEVLKGTKPALLAASEYVNQFLK